MSDEPPVIGPFEFGPGKIECGPLPVGAIQASRLPEGAIQQSEMALDDLARYVGFPDAAAYLQHLGLPPDATLDDVAMRMLGFPYGPSTDDLIRDLEDRRPLTLRERLARLFRR